jgi:3-hydroxyacyl-CoA dehydrogenase
MKIAIVGAGVIGSAWAIVFARAGHDVALFDRDAGARAALPARLAAQARDAAAPGSASQVDVLARIGIVEALSDALQGAAYVQECVTERLPLKQAIFAELDALAAAETVLASSTSSFGMSSIAGELAGRARMIVAHPATPPHLLPVIEIVPAPFTDPQVTQQVTALMRAIGQKPVMVNREVPGFVMNRFQGALLIEMFRAIGEGLVSPEDADTLIRDGFGLRWAFLGPLEGVDLNAPGGIADYLARYGFIIDDQARDAGATGPVVTPAIVAQLQEAMRRRRPLEALPERLEWRDRSMAALRRLRGDPP